MSFSPSATSDEIKIVVAVVLLFFATLLTYQIRSFVRAYLTPRDRCSVENANDESALPLLQLTSSDRCSSYFDFSRIVWSNVLTVFLNGEIVQLVNPDPTALLSSFIRDDRGLKGTKLGCEEGGCGACTVVLTRECPSDSTSITNISVNSCLRPLCANDGMAITTIEGIGSVREGLSEEQSRLVKCNGTQCGFCTPGWVTNMHALNISSGSEGSCPSKREIDSYFDGNICRCTGYKPIMKAFQSFSHEASPLSSSQSDSCAGLCASKKNCPKLNQPDEKSAGCCSMSDIEEISACCSAKKVDVSVVSDKAKKNQQLIISYVPKPLMFYDPLKSVRWVRPVNLKQLCAVLKHYSNDRVQLVGGNTSIGVTKYLNKSGPYNRADAYDVFVDINLVPEMDIKLYNTSSRTATIGAAVPINEVIALLQKNSTKTSRTPTGCNSEEVNNHSVFSVTAHHLTKIANTQVRNAGTWAGNLMVFMHYTTFPSDAVIALATANARLQLCNADGEMSAIDMGTFLNMDYASFLSQGSIILSMSITEPRLSAGSVVVAETFKVAQRTANAHAHVNCGFQFSISYQRQQDMVYPVCTYARVVIGGVSKKTFIAARTESALTNAFVCANTLGNALAALDVDLKETGESQQFGNQSFRKSVMQTCLYRALLKCYPLLQLPQNLLSAVQPWVKPASRGTEVFLPPSDEKPVGLPVRKLEGPIQATGEAVFPSDEVMTAQGLHGAMIFSTRCAVKLAAFDFSAALATPGVVAILTSDDIPTGGVNSIADKYPLFIPIGSDVPCVGATLAVVVASTESVANEAAALVRVIYTETGIVPVISLSQAVEKKSFYSFPPPGVIPGVTLIRAGNADKAMNAAYRTVSGQASAGGQYHFYMETQTAVASIVDGDVVTVTCGTQFPANSQNSIASLLGVQQNKVQVKCPRAGGAFGGKITRGMAVSGAAALCAFKLGKPVRIFNTRTADMNMQSGREAWQMNYEVGFSEDGHVTALKYDFYIDAGCANDDAIGNLFMGMNWADNAYYFPNYKATGTVCYTNTPPRTFVRAPGVVQSCLFTEMVIARVAAELNLPLETVQSRNFIQNGETTILGQPIKDCTLPTVWSTLLERSRYQERLSLCQKYNQTSSSLWRKKGIAICPVKYGMGWSGGFNAGVKIGIIASDGTVCVNHSGAEIGQGMNTKVAQAVAYGLGVPIDIIRITCNTTDNIANAGCTGGSGGSEVTVQAALNACAEMNARLEPYKQPGKSWADMIASIPCDVSLNAEGWFSPVENPNGQPFQYFVYAACVTEVELDVLSGNMHILASEIVYDCGKSLNPAVDIGQIEGGLIMGLGYFLTEKMEYGEDGTLLSTGTWEYKPPTAQDVPSVLNVTLLRNVNNPDGILGSKAVGEPPNIVANSFYFALRMAVGAARADAGVTGHFNLDVPATVDLRQQTCLVSPSRFVMPY